jgi:hypothetical protein
MKYRHSIIPLNVPNPLKKKSIWEVRSEFKVVEWKSYTSIAGAQLLNIRKILFPVSLRHLLPRFQVVSYKVLLP